MHRDARRARLARDEGTGTPGPVEGEGHRPEAAREGSAKVVPVDRHDEPRPGRPDHLLPVLVLEVRVLPADPVVTHGGLSAGMGGAVHGDVGDRVTVTVRVRNAGGMRLLVKGKGGTLLHLRWLSSDDETARIRVSIPAGGGYVRAEVRGRPNGPEGDMEAITNPVWLRVGDAPAGAVSDVPPVPQRVGPRRTV